MEVVWPVTALYYGPAAVWGYPRFGWPKSPQWRAEHGLDQPPEEAGLVERATGVSHCGAGCTLGALGLRMGLVEAAKADVLSLTSFEVGLFGWMALVQFVFFPHHIHADHAAFWFLIQVGMIVGYFTAWPVNVWLMLTWPL